MLPILFKIGPVPIHSYGLMIATGFLTALFFVQRDVRKAGLDPKVFADGAFWVLLLGVAGTRLMHIILYPQFYSWSDPIGWISVWKGGLVFHGALPPALIFSILYLRKHNLTLMGSADFIFPYLPMAHAIGRLGCFLNGCCYGKTSEVPWAVQFRRVPWDLDQSPSGSPVYLDHLRRFSDVSLSDHWSHAVHPTQIYSALGLISICLFLLFLRSRWKPFEGFTMAAYFALYGVHRFIVEFFRGDHNPVHFASISDQQTFSIVLAVFGVGLFVFLRRRKAPPGAAT